MTTRKLGQYRVAPADAGNANKGKSLLPKKKPDLPSHESRKCSTLYCEESVTRCLADYISDVVTALGYEECHVSSNLRIVACTVACSIAGLSFLCNVKTHRFLLCTAVISFFCIITALFIYEHLTVKCAVISIKDKAQRQLYLDMSLNRPTSEITFAIRQNGQTLSRKIYLGKLFTENGYMVTDTVYDEIRDLLTGFEAGSIDAVEDILADEVNVSSSSSNKKKR